MVFKTVVNGKRAQCKGQRQTILVIIDCEASQSGAFWVYLMSCSFSLFTTAASWNVAGSSLVSHGHREEFGEGVAADLAPGERREVASSMGNSLCG